MDYDLLTNLVADVGYHLAMAGAETWLKETLAACRSYAPGVVYLGHLLVGLGFRLVNRSAGK